MTQVPLAPPPPTGGPLDGWLYLLWRRLTQEAQIFWSSIAPTTSADIAATVTDETGTAGNLVFSGNPTLQGLNVTTAAFTSRGITDNATATALTIDSSKNVGIGAAPELSFTLELSSSAGGGPNIAMKKTGVPTIDSSMFAFAGYASNSSALALGGTINFKASEGWTTTANGTYIQFRTVKGTTTTLGEAARMWDTGAFTAGGPSTAPAIKVTPVASQARWIEVTGATSSGNPQLATTAGELLLPQNIVLPKTSGKGIQVDTAAPTFGWRDIIGQIGVKTIGATDPVWAVYRGAMYAYTFDSAVAEAFMVFHIPHDYVPGSDMFVHAHWSQNVVDTGGTAGVPGNIEWNFDITYADGHGTAGGAADPFIAPITVTVVQQASTTQYGHMIAEVQFTNNGGTGGLIDSATIQVDGLLLVRVYRVKANAADTLNQAPFGHTIDVHYQSTNIGTKQKAPNFYT